MEKIKLIIFDLDGTLIDAYPAIIRSFNYTMHRLGLPIQDNVTIRRAVGHGDEKLLRPFIKRTQLKEAVSLYRQHHSQALIEDSHLFPGAKRVLAYLKDKGYKLAVASNRPTRFSWILIAHLRLKKYFAYVLCADTLKQGKPHPEILCKIMRKFGVSSTQALYVGDMTVDAITGRRAGVKTIIVTTGSSTKEEIKKEKPALIIRKITALLEIL